MNSTLLLKIMNGPQSAYDCAVCARETGQNTKCSGFCSVYYLKRGDQFTAFFANT